MFTNSTYNTMIQANNVPTMNKSRPSTPVTPLKFTPLELPCLSIDEQESMDIGQDYADELEIEILDEVEYSYASSSVDAYLSMSTSSPATDECSMDYSFDVSPTRDSAASDASMKQMVTAAISSMDSIEMCCAMLPCSSSKPE